MAGGVAGCRGVELRRRGIRGRRVATGEVAPVARLVGKLLGTLHGRLKADELALKIPLATCGLLRPDTDELLDENGALPEGSRLFVVRVAIGVDVHVVNLREVCGRRI